VSYVHAEAYAAGEVKHGPIALVDKDMLIIFLLGKGHLAEKSQSNLQEIKARGGTVITIADTAVSGDDQSLRIKTHSPWTEPLVLNIVLQLLAYHMAVARGCDVDKPRNLAKSVTVE
jgi:glucosamine--fructose-6-phosphate aminotransferase (isomerizing)